MAGTSHRKVVLFALRNALEHNPATVYRTIFVGETAAVIEAFPGWECETVDIDIDDVSLTKVIALLGCEPAAVFLWADVHHARLARQIGELAKKVSPASRIFAFGRATSFIPQYFERHPFDVVHISGDREATIASLIANLEDPATPISGAAIRDGASDSYRRSAPLRLAPAAWPLPALGRMPIEEYGRFADTHHAPGYARRIAVTAAKGCAWDCAYCSATHEEGGRDRRRGVDVLFDWFARSRIEGYNCLVHLYAPDLFVDQEWIRRFAQEYLARASAFSWRGVTTTRTLQDPATVQEAGAAGCREVAVGIEHASRRSGNSVKSSIREIEVASRLTREAGIALKGLVMLGYPGQTEDDVLFAEEIADACGIRLRYTGYTPLHRLRKLDVHTLDSIVIESFDRRTFRDERSTLSPAFFYQRIVANGGYHHPRATAHDPMTIAM